MRVALGLLAAFVAGIVVFVVTMRLGPASEHGASFGEFLDALPASVTAGALTFAAITTWVIVTARRRKRRDDSSDRPLER